MNTNKLIIDDNEDDTSSVIFFSEERLSSNNANRFSYGRIIDSMHDIRKKSNLNKYIFVGVIVLLFFICFLTTVLFNNKSNNENKISFNVTSNTTGREFDLTQHANATEMIFTQKTIDFHENSSKGSTTGFRSTTESTVGVVNKSVSNVSIVNNIDSSSEIPVLVSSGQVDDMKGCLKGFAMEPDGFESLENIKKCNFYEDPVKVKTKIRFIMGDSLFFICLLYERTCDFYFDFETNKHIIDHGFKDIYFNYIIGVNGNMYQGRHLSCSFDEHFLPEDHTSVLIVGIPNCNYLHSEKKFDVDRFNQQLNRFLTCSENAGLLRQNYTMEFHWNCKDFLLGESILKSHHDKIVFVDNDDLNFETYFKIKIY